MSMAICPRPFSILYKRPTLLERILTEKNKVGGLMFSDFKTYPKPRAWDTGNYICGM